MGNNDALREAGKTWLKANSIIIRSIREWSPTVTKEQAEKFASALQARLAQADLLICKPEEIKE